MGLVGNWVNRSNGAALLDTLVICSHYEVAYALLEDGCAAKGKPVVRRGRKATGLLSIGGSRAAEQRGEAQCHTKTLTVPKVRPTNTPLIYVCW